MRDYLGKNGFPSAIIGLSGGIDSALTLCIAVDALGAERVRAVMMPSPYTAQMSLDDSRELVRALGVRYDELLIEPAMRTFEQLLAPLFEGRPSDTTEENLQARIRGMNLMALSNKLGGIVLTTGNKSEMAVGYATLYGDMAGGFAVIKDILKTFVYRLCRYRNTLSFFLVPVSHPREHHHLPARRPSSSSIRKTRIPCRPTRCSTPSSKRIWSAIRVPAKSSSLATRRPMCAASSPCSSAMSTKRRNRLWASVGLAAGFGKDWRYPITNRYQDEY